MTTATKKDPPTIPADTEHVITLTAAQVAQHPANLRDPVRDIDRLAASISGVGVLVPLIVVPVNQVPGQWPKKVTHVAVDGNRRQQQHWVGDVEQLRVTLDHLLTKKDQVALLAGLPTTAVLTAAAPTTISLPFMAG